MTYIEPTFWCQIAHYLLYRPLPSTPNTPHLTGCGMLTLSGMGGGGESSLIKLMDSGCIRQKFLGFLHVTLVKSYYYTCNLPTQILNKRKRTNFEEDNTLVRSNFFECIYMV
jgi:hypothetical protein